MTLDDCDKQFKAVRGAKSIAEACYELGPLLNAYQVISFAIGRGGIYWRARKASAKPWQSIKEMGYPPAHLAALGRLNDKHAPYFYAAARDQTALMEINAVHGDFVQVAGFRVLGDEVIRMAVVGELHHVQKTGYLRMFGSDPGSAISNAINKLSIGDGTRWVYIDAPC